MKVGRPAARQALEANSGAVVSECPLAALHILQGMKALDEEGIKKGADKQEIPEVAPHPIEIIAKAYGL